MKIYRNMFALVAQIDNLKEEIERTRVPPISKFKMKKKYLKLRKCHEPEVGKSSIYHDFPLIFSYRITTGNHTFSTSASWHFFVF